MPIATPKKKRSYSKSKKYITFKANRLEQSLCKKFYKNQYYLTKTREIGYYIEDLTTQL
jgi:hypothetical protein